MADDIELIKETLNHFFDSLDNCCGNSLKLAFDKSGTIHTFDPDEDRIIQDLALNGWPEDIEKNKNNPEYFFNKEKSKKRIVFVDITEDVASAKVEWIFPSLTFTDYYHLIKAKGKWVIVDKIWNTKSNMKDQ